MSIIRTFPSRRQPGTGFGLEEQIGEVMELHDMLRRRPENSAEYFNESNGRVSNSLLGDPHPHDFNSQMKSSFLTLDHISMRRKL